MVDARLAGYTQQVATAQAQLGRELALTEMLAHTISPLDILHALSEMFRDRTQVAWTIFNIINLHEPQTARITFNLEGASHPAINTLLLHLNAPESLQMSDRVRLQRFLKKKTDFQVQVRCNLTASAVRASLRNAIPCRSLRLINRKRSRKYKLNRLRLTRLN